MLTACLSISDSFRSLIREIRIEDLQLTEVQSDVGVRAVMKHSYTPQLVSV